MNFISDALLSANGNEIVISVSPAPERGQANAEMVKKLAPQFRLDYNSVWIVSSLTSRKKIVQISCGRF